MSIPPPSGVQPPVAGSGHSEPDRRREIVLELAGGGRRRRPGLLRLLGSQLTLTQPGVLREPLTLAGGLVAVAAVELGGRRATGEHGRFPVLNRVSPTRVLSFEHGIEGWLWTARDGSSLPVIGEAGDAPPNLALLFHRPLADEQVRSCFEPDWVRVLADRSPLASPSIPGLLLVAADPGAAEEAFRRFGVLGPVTDREIPPSMRRHLAADKPANPRIATSEAGRARTSVPPPGMG
jgi:hypothetical protein